MMRKGNEKGNKSVLIHLFEHLVFSSNVVYGSFLINLVIHTGRKSNLLNRDFLRISKLFFFSEPIYIYIYISRNSLILLTFTHYGRIP